MRFVIITAFAIFVASGCSSKKKHDEAHKAPTAAKAEAAAKDAKKADAAKEASSATTKVECKLKGDTRILEVRAKDKGCETAYTKAGQENIVGSSQYNTAHCEGIVNRIKEKLENAGFKCE